MLLACFWHAPDVLLACKLLVPGLLPLFSLQAACPFLACFCVLSRTKRPRRSGSGLDRVWIGSGSEGNSGWCNIQNAPFGHKEQGMAAGIPSLLASGSVLKARLQPRLCCATLLHLAQPCPELGGPFRRELYQIVRRRQCQCLGPLHLELQR